MSETYEEKLDRVRREVARECAEIAAHRSRLLNGDAAAMRRAGRHDMADIAEIKAKQFVWMEHTIRAKFGVTE